LFLYRDCTKRGANNWIGVHVLVEEYYRPFFTTHFLLIDGARGGASSYKKLIIQEFKSNNAYVAKSNVNLVKVSSVSTAYSHHP